MCLSWIQSFNILVTGRQIQCRHFFHVHVQVNKRSDKTNASTSSSWILSANLYCLTYIHTVWLLKQKTALNHWHMIFLSVSFQKMVSKVCTSHYISIYVYIRIIVIYASELRPVLRINVNKYTFMTLIFCRLYSLKKRTRGPWATLLTWENSSNDYIITLIKIRKKTLTLWEFTFSSFEETWIPFIQECFVLRLVEIGSLVLEKKIF